MKAIFFRDSGGHWCEAFRKEIEPCTIYVVEHVAPLRMAEPNLPNVLAPNVRTTYRMVGKPVNKEDPAVFFLVGTK